MTRAQVDYLRELFEGGEPPKGSHAFPMVYPPPNRPPPVAYRLKGEGLVTIGRKDGCYEVKLSSLGVRLFTPRMSTVAAAYRRRVPK